MTIRPWLLAVALALCSLPAPGSLPRPEAIEPPDPREVTSPLESSPARPPGAFSLLSRGEVPAQSPGARSGRFAAYGLPNAGPSDLEWRVSPTLPSFSQCPGSSGGPVSSVTGIPSVRSAVAPCRREYDLERRNTTGSDAFGCVTRREYDGDRGGELRMLGADGTALSASAHGWNRLFRGGDHIGFGFEVEGDHDYFVGESALLVHNACPRIKPMSAGSSVDLSGRSVGFGKGAHPKGKGYVYVLREQTTGEVLKVGKTTGGSNIYRRFDWYRRKSRQWGHKVEADYWEVADSRSALDLETQIRASCRFSRPMDPLTPGFSRRFPP